jgi:hypothetical protein
MESFEMPGVHQSFWKEQLGVGKLMYTNVLKMMYFLIKAEHISTYHATAERLYLSQDSDVISDQHFRKLCIKVVANCNVCKQEAEDRARHKAYLARITVPLRISTVSEADQTMIHYYTVNNNNLVQISGNNVG